MCKISCIALLFLFFSCKTPKKEESKVLNFVKLDFPVYLGKQDTLVPKDNPISEQGFALGRQLFYDKILSKDKSISCASCHIQKFGFTDVKQFSDGVGGKVTARHSMPIVNAMWQNHFFWDGRANTLEEQAVFPIENENEMNLPIDSALARLNKNSEYVKMFFTVFGTSVITKDVLGKAISQFERSLISFDSKFDKVRRGEATYTEEEKLGEELFFTHPDPGSTLRGGNCGDCHSGILTTNTIFFNNGIDPSNTDIGFQKTSNSNTDLGKFKVPSLRNVALREKFMHDGKLNSLEEVLDHYNNKDLFSHASVDKLILKASNSANGTSLALTEPEKNAIIAFLKTLTDENFITNPKFSNPFE